jgi:hypothetical protein
LRKNAGFTLAVIQNLRGIGMIILIISINRNFYCEY